VKTICGQGGQFFAILCHVFYGQPLTRKQLISKRYPYPRFSVKATQYTYM